MLAHHLAGEPAVNGGCLFLHRNSHQFYEPCCMPLHATANLPTNSSSLLAWPAAWQPCEGTPHPDHNMAATMVPAGQNWASRASAMASASARSSGEQLLSTSAGVQAGGYILHASAGTKTGYMCRKLPPACESPVPAGALLYTELANLAVRRLAVAATLCLAVGAESLKRT
jgi:hypothetical protein